MHVVFAHPEPVDPARARWVAMVRSLAAVAQLTPVTWFTPDRAARVHEYAREHLGLELPPGLNVETLPSVRKRMGVITINRVFFRSFIKAMARAEPDVLWLRSDKLAAFAAHKLPDTPMVYEAHLVGELYAQDKRDDRRAKRLFELERDIYAHAAGVAAITHGLLDEIRARFEYTGPGAVVPSAVDTALFRPVWDGGDGQTIVYVGTLQAWKGLDTLLQAIAQIELKLRIVGGGSAEEERKLKARAEELGIRERIEITGRVSQRNIPLHVKGAACAVHPLPPGHSVASRFTSPLKVFEYMAMGLPIVAADVPSVREVLKDGQNARLYEPGSADALASVLGEVAGDLELAQQLSGQAATDAERYSYAERAAKLVALFREVSSGARGPTRPSGR